MTLAPGSRLGSYEITAKLGEGGMGEVYRATDPKLRREVAIKVLPAAFTADPERLARFEREAQLLAQLHHPNIASIFGLEESGGTRALVMELVEGRTLAERLESGPLPLDEALEIACRIAEALEEAHEKNIVHRDLKPANVKLTADGKVKVLDFGLAKALDSRAPSSSSATLMNSPTLTGAHGTQIGVILGTAAYMAPEQAAGGTIDRRADVWAFGVVLYEMVTGRRLFDGETTSHVLAGVLKDEPDFSALPPATPRRIEDLLRRCLRKKPRERLQAIGDARLAIEDVLAEPLREDKTPAAAAGQAASRRTIVPWAVAGLGLAAATLFAVLWARAPRAAAPPSVLDVSLVPPAQTRFTDNFALSPDARRVVFETYDIKTGALALWLRELDRATPRRLEAAATGGTNPFWSPDSSQVAFFADGKLKRLDPRGGPAHTLAEAPTPRGGAWAPDGSIIFSSSFRTGLSLVPAAGGGARELTTLDASRNEKSHRFPVVLPDGKTVIFVAQTAEAGARDDDSSIEALDLASGKRTRLVTANSAPLFAPPRTLLYWREGALLAQRLDLERWAVVGDPEPIASPVAFTQNEQPLASLSGEGMLVYRGGTRGTFSSFVLLDRSGIGVKVLRDRELFSGFALSHDGKRLAYTVNALGQGSTDIWIYDLDRDATSRLTFEEGSESFPTWSRDGRQLYYANDSRNDGVIFRRPADGAGAAEEIATTPSGIWPEAASPDGAWLAVGSVGSDTKLDILRLDLATGEKTPLAATPFDDQGGVLSPDGSLLAYCSDQAGRWEVYVQALSGARGRWQVSSEGGVEPRWRGDGRELFFMIPPDRMMVVDVEPGEVPRFSAPRELFREPIQGFVVSPDGQHFVALRSADEAEFRPLTLVSHWMQRLRQPAAKLE